MLQPILSCDPVVSARGLTKRYGSVEALRSIDLEVRRGEILALLGPNGAGKTTALELLEGFRRPTDGEILVLGHDPARGERELRERIGIVLQESQPDAGLTVRECLELYAGYYRDPRDVDQTLALVGLGPHADQAGELLSGGQRRRLDVALALIGDPELLFLDEPTTGFDPSARRSAWTMVAGLRSLGKTILLTTHYMDEAERLADRIVVLAGGRIVAEGAPGTLGGRDRQAATIRFTLPDWVDPASLPPSLLPAQAEAGGRVRLRSHDPLLAVRDLADWAGPQGLDLDDLEVARPMLEDVYLALTAADGSEVA